MSDVVGPRKKVAVKDLHFGMYVFELDRPWTETPFMFQGFHLKTDQQLAALKKHCKHVFIDLERTEKPEPRVPAARFHNTPALATSPLVAEKAGQTPSARFCTVHERRGPTRAWGTGEPVGPSQGPGGESPRLAA